MPKLPADIRCTLRCLAGAALILYATLSSLPAAYPPEQSAWQNEALSACAELIALPCSLADDLQFELLARVIAGEAGGMSYIEQICYGAMLHNRMADPRFPRELGQVIGSAQLHIADGTIPTRALRAARAAGFGIDPTNGALYCFPADDTAARALFGDRITAEFEHLIFAR